MGNTNNMKPSFNILYLRNIWFVISVPFDGLLLYTSTHQSSIKKIKKEKKKGHFFFLC